jgi:hypothetical protein
MKKYLLVAILSLLLASPALAAAIGSEAGIFGDGIRVYYTTDPARDSMGIPLAGDPNRATCTVDATEINLITNAYSTVPTLVTVLPYDPNEASPNHADVFAVADCMPQLTSWVRNNYSAGVVLIDVSPLFDDHGTGGGPNLHPYYQQRAAAFYDIVSGGTHFTASELLGIVVRQEAPNWTNSEVNLAIQHGPGSWSAGNGWNQVDTVAGFPANASGSLNRANGVFPWRLDVPVLYSYPTYNPNDPNSSLNFGGFFYDPNDQFNSSTQYDQWVDQLQSHQKAALNVRGFLLDSEKTNHNWTESTVRWTQFAWCRWTSRQSRLDFDWTVIWKYTDEPGTGIQALETLNQIVPNLHAQTEEYFQLAWGTTSTCDI